MSRSYCLLYYQINLLFSSFFQIFLQLTTRSFTINAMQLTVLNNGTQLILDFGPDSVVLSVKDFDENFTISSLEIPPAAWSLLLSQRQKLLNDHLPRVPITPNQRGTFEMRDEVPSSVGAQDTDTKGNELSDLEDIEFIWEDSGYGQCLLTWNWYIIFPIHIRRYSFGGINRCQPNKSCWWGRQGEFSSNSNNNTRVWASHRTPRLLKSRLFGTRLENVLESVNRTLFR